LDDDTGWAFVKLGSTSTMSFSDIASGDRGAEIRLGQQYLTLAPAHRRRRRGRLRVDVMVPCPHDDKCTGRAWAPAYSVTCLFRAPNGDLADDEDIVCTVHGPNNGDDQDDDPDGRADLETQAPGVGVSREVSGESRPGTAIRRAMS
jgi:hypothetical protein